MRMKDRFHLVICMVGSASCNPVLESMLQRYWDDRFFFSAWDTEFINRLLVQQEDLKKGGKNRSVLLLVDDVVMTRGGRTVSALVHAGEALPGFRYYVRGFVYQPAEAG